MTHYLSIINCPYNNADKFDLDSLNARETYAGDTVPVTKTRCEQLELENYRTSMQRPSNFKAIQGISSLPTNHSSRFDKSEFNNQLTQINGISGEVFTLINSKTPSCLPGLTYGKGKKILGMGSSCKVREAAWYKDQKTWVPVVVKKVSTGYAHKTHGGSPDNPKWKRIGEATVKRTLHSLELTPKDEHFLQQIDSAIFEQTGDLATREKPLMKLYAFFPRCKSDLKDFFHQLEQNHEKLSSSQTKKWATRCLDTLFALRKYNIAHMDIKLDNFLIDEDDNLLLGDFAFMMPTNPKDRHTKYPSDFGTRKYIPNELNNGEWVEDLPGHKLMQRDIIAMAQMFHYMGTGEFFEALPTALTRQELDTALFCDTNGFHIRPNEQYALADVAREIFARILVDGKDMRLEEIQDMAYFRN